MKHTLLYGGMTITLFLVYSGVVSRASDSVNSMFNVILTLLLTVVLINVVLAWVSANKPSYVLYMAVCWSGLIFLNAGFVPLGLLLVPVLLFLALNTALQEKYQISDQVKVNELSGISVTSPNLNGDFPLEWSTIRPVLESVSLFLFFPAVVLSVFALINTGFAYMSPDHWALHGSNIFASVSHSASMNTSVQPVTLLVEALPTEVTPRLVAFLFVVWIALWQLGSQPLYFYLSAVPFLSLLIASIGQSEFSNVFPPDLVFAVSVLTTCVVSGFLSGRVARWGVISAVVLSMSFSLVHVFQGAMEVAPPNRQPVVSLETVPDVTERSEQPSVASQSDQTSPSIETEVQREAHVTSPSEPAYTVSWNDNDRYYFEVKVVNSTSSGASRNYQRWLDQDETGQVTLFPQYQDGRFVRWLVGVGRYTTFWDAANAIRSTRGEEALDEAFIVLHHYTDFRVFGIAPDYNPAEPGYTLLLGTFTTRSEADLAAAAWNQIGLNQVRIIAGSAERRYQLLTGKYNDETEARLLAEFATRKSGIDIQAVLMDE